MTSLRENTENEAVVRRIESLQASATPQWGKMNAAQMFAHCQRGLHVATGELTLKRSLVGKLIGGFAKKRFVNGDAPWRRNLPTDPSFIVPDAHDVERERATLVELVQRYADTGATTSGPHPFFGPMDPDEWDRLMWKHLDHHLLQFAV